LEDDTRTFYVFKAGGSMAGWESFYKGARRHMGSDIVPQSSDDFY